MRKFINGQYVEMTTEEIAAREAEACRYEAAERTRPLTMEEVERLLIRRQVNSLDIGDDTASRMAEYFPVLTGDGSLVRAGTRVNWGGALKRAAVDLWDEPGSTPDAAPALWEDIGYKDGVRVIPETITDAAAFALGGLGWWGDTLYRSLLDANVRTPEQYPGGWEKL